MPAINRTFTLTLANSPKAFTLPQSRHSLHTTSSLSRDSQFHRSDFQSQGYSASYEPGRPTEGPLAKASNIGTPRLTPSLLKEHLDKFVVGQDKAKKVTSVAIFNHYQRIRELRRQEEDEQARREQQARWELRERERNSHPVENEYPGHVESVDLNSPRSQPSEPEPELGSVPLEDAISPHTTIEKSNLLLLGPSGVGKTYIIQTLARVLEVPFATVDCSSLTQAGYIGTDIESSIERLLLASNHSIQKCETGIIFFDEVDKLAKPAVMTHGRDVSGEGVQQGLLKMIEGTTVTVNAKGDRNSKTERGNERLERGGREGGVSGGPSGKSEQYTIDTRNILFVFAGAFVGLDKIVANRLQSGSSLGFGAQLRSPKSPSSSKSKSSSKSNISVRMVDKPKDPLASLTPSDLQSYGLIPELLGRIPILTSLLPLSLSQLVSILTEPKNSLVKQYTALFNTYGIQLKFTTASLHAVAERALYDGSKDGERKSAGVTGGGIGARGLRSIMENVLGEIMFRGPGSGIRFCLVDEKFVRDHGSQLDEEAEDAGDKAMMPRCWSRGQGRVFEEAYEKEEQDWKEKIAEQERRDAGEEGEEAGSFEQFRRVGSSGM